MHIAVSGSTGFIGSALCAALRADGHVVIPMVRTPPADADARVVLWDPDAGTIDRAALDGVEAVVHLAGAGIGDRRWSASRKALILESRTKGTSLLATTLAGLDQKPTVLVSASAIGYYGDRGDEVLTEASTPGDIFLSEVCTEWERAAQPAIDAGIRVAFARTGIVLGAGGGVLGRMGRLFTLCVGGKLGSGRQWMSWISLDDEVAALRWLLERDISGPVNLVAPGPVTNAEFTKALGGALHRPTILPAPAFGLHLALGTEMADQLLLASQRVSPAVLQADGFPFRHPDLATCLAAVLG